MAIEYIYNRSSATPWTDLAMRDLDTKLNMVLWMDAPLQNLAKRGPKPMSRHVEWHVDTVTQPTSVTNATEGGSAPTATTEVPTILSNAIHHADEGFGVSNLDRLFPTSWGVTDTYGDQAARAVQRLIMQTDFNLLWSTYSASTTTHKTSGLIQYVATSGAVRNEGSDASLAGATVPNDYCSFLTNVGATVTTSVLNTNLRTFFEAGTSLDNCVCMMAPVMKPVFDALLSTQTVSASTVVPLQRFTRPLDDGMIGATVDYVRTSWGTFTLMVNKWMAGQTKTINVTGTTYDVTVNGDQDIIIFNDELYEHRWAQPYEEFERAQTDKSSQGWIEATVVPVYRNPKGFCMLLDVN